jgi:methylglutamate dehydrogenase subunit D
MAANLSLTPRAAFPAAMARHQANGIVVVERDGLGLATMQARKGRLDALRRRVRDEFGLELPMRPQRASSGGVAFAAVAPMTWLASSEGGGPAFAAHLAGLTADAAAVADQGDGFAVLRLSGRDVRELLARLVPIDVHERAFPVGSVASSVAGHVGVTLWRLDDADGAPAFELALYRSFAHGFARLLGAALGGLGGDRG